MAKLVNGEDMRAKVQVHKVVLLVVDHDNLGPEGLRQEIENVNYPNDCVSPGVMSIETREIEWTDDHPLNLGRTQRAEFARLFGS